MQLAASQGTEPGFAPGFNGEARKPPMGWRSWNAFGAHISQDLMKAQIDVLVTKNHTVHGGKVVSLADIGYASAGIDEGWEGCGMGVNHTQHYINGTPAVNSKFPDIKALVQYGHSKNLKMGFYQNGCACGEHHELDINYHGDVAFLKAMDFDGVKLDGCGAQRNLTKYAHLMKVQGRNYSIENCHWGAMNAIGCEPGSDSSACILP